MVRGTSYHRLWTNALIASVMAFGLLYVCSCSDDIIELPSLVLDDPVVDFDSIRITARINLREVKPSRISDVGFHWGEDGSAPSTISLGKPVIENNASSHAFSGEWTAPQLSLNTKYYFQAYIEVDEGLIHSKIDTASTTGIVLTTSFSATGERVRDELTEETSEKVQFFGRLDGLRENVVVTEVGHIWIERETNLPPGEWNNFDINTADSVQSFPPPSSEPAFDFPDAVRLNPSKYYYVRPFAKYNGLASYGNAREVFIGNIWELVGQLPTAVTNAVSFVIDEKAYIVTGCTSIDFGLVFQDSLALDSTKLYSEVIVCDPQNDDPAMRFTEDSQNSFPGVLRTGAVAFTLDGKGYVGSGRNGTTILNDFYSYDPNKTNNRWEQVDSLLLSVYDAFSFVVESQGKAYVGAGNMGTSNEGDFDPTAAVCVFNGEKWEDGISFGPLPNGFANPVTWTVEDESYVATGHQSISTAPHLNSSFVFVPGAITGVFVEHVSFAGVPRQGSVAFTIDSRAYLGAGTNRVNGLDPTFRDYYVFDYDNPELGWKEVDGQGNALYCGATAFSIGGKGYVCGGLRKSGLSYPLTDASVWQYTPTPKN